MVAPESPYVAPAPTNGNGHVYSAPPPPAANEPQWPDAPSWPTPVPAASRTRGAEAVWAESTRDLLSRPETGVSACFNCGLPLSATARFCRRCGTSQVSA
jgi:ribosomal protein L40E